ncbi:MAG TPA: hypothetical protein DDX39_05535 [Bacteroidales bacterium]|nr:MAG: hypothetical protein A2W98_06805 [Bacteroidetes bacterium GWF2_33_38]OFY71583.1 MAG: hypothetical protein A2265_01735 [Bacteroidetes bacterium RIFOXYA12_FULL_33_9]HBF88085.1 hypothetical protein [Bacteroidales bacterium]
MEVRKGDRVRFLNETGGGIVASVDKKIVHVKIEDGFILPISIDEIIVLKDDESKKTENNNRQAVAKPLINEPIEIHSHFSETSEINIQHSDDEINICAGFVPDKSSDEKINLFLINDSGFELLFNALALWDKQWGNLETGILESNTKVHISSFMRSELNTISAIMLQGILFKKGIYTPYEPIDETIKLKASRFFKKNSYVENDYFDENGIIINFMDEILENENDEELTREEIKKILDEKMEINLTETKNVKKTISDVIDLMEVDLHIEKLIEKYVGMSNSEILIHQISHFRTKLEYAMLNNVRKIVFIHGVGNGTLKHELRKTLTEFYPDLKFQDASFMEYGYGATLVFLK